MRPLAALACCAVVATGCAGSAAEGPLAPPVSRKVPGAPEQADEIVTLHTRRGVSQKVLLLARTGTEPRAVAVMFPGGAGAIRLPDDPSRLELGGNFLIRTRELFRDDDVAVAIVDAPSDRQRAGMSDDFRSGGEHRRDLSALVEELRRRFPQARIFLVGTSRGTVSAAWVGRALGAAVDGVVLTSTVFESNGRATGLAGFDFAQIRAPLLFVHHIDDGCAACPYVDAARLAAHYPLVSVRGGRPPESGPCDPFAAHGYFGRERETVAAIKAWMLGRPYPRLVE
jgi:predicted alpha/beta-hydrolase family hydrolase